MDMPECRVIGDKAYRVDEIVEAPDGSKRKIVDFGNAPKNRATVSWVDVPDGKIVWTSDALEWQYWVEGED
jgi:hypothetical protein